MSNSITKNHTAIDTIPQVKAALKPPLPTPAFPLAEIPSMRAQKLDGQTYELKCYIASATHLGGFVRKLGVTAYNIGVTSHRDPKQRMLDKRRKRDGSLLIRPDDPSDAGIVLQNGHEWFLMPIEEADLLGTDLPTGFRLENNIIVLRVPTYVTVAQVDQAVHDMLKPRCLHAYLATPDGQARMITAGYDPKARLHTPYNLMTPMLRISLMTEIYLIRPRRELTGFIAALAEMVKNFGSS